MPVETVRLEFACVAGSHSRVGTRDGPKVSEEGVVPTPYPVGISVNQPPMSVWEHVTNEQVLSFPGGPGVVDDESEYRILVRRLRGRRERTTRSLVRSHKGRNFVWCVKRRRSQWLAMCEVEGCLLAIQGRGRCSTHGLGRAERIVEERRYTVELQSRELDRERAVLLELADGLLRAHYPSAESRVLRREMGLPELHTPTPTVA